MAEQPASQRLLRPPAIRLFDSLPCPVEAGWCSAHPLCALQGMLLACCLATPQQVGPLGPRPIIPTASISCLTQYHSGECHIRGLWPAAGIRLSSPSLTQELAMKTAFRSHGSFSRHLPIPIPPARPPTHLQYKSYHDLSLKPLGCPMQALATVWRSFTAAWRNWTCLPRWTY